MSQVDNYGNHSLSPVKVIRHNVYSLIVKAIDAKQAAISESLEIDLTGLLSRS